MNFGIERLHKKLSGKRDFRENWFSGSYTLLKSVYEFVNVHTRFIDKFG
jgi:hypothetical protein